MEYRTYTEIIHEGLWTIMMFLWKRGAAQSDPSGWGQTGTYVYVNI